MTDDELLQALLYELDETFDGEGLIALYQFAWSLRGLVAARGLEPLDDATIQRVSAPAYPVVVERYDLTLKWTRWPIDLDALWDAEPGTPLDFDLDPDGDVNTPLLVLVPRQPPADGE